MTESGFTEVYVPYQPEATRKLDTGDKILVRNTYSDDSEDWALGEVVSWKEIYLKSTQAS